MSDNSSRNQSVGKVFTNPDVIKIDSDVLTRLDSDYLKGEPVKQGNATP